VVFSLIDEARRSQGSVVDLLGLGRRVRAKRTARSASRWMLAAYQESGEVARSPCLLMPAPIKHAYIFDLAPGASVVAHCLGGGFATYVMEWQPPAQSDAEDGLAEYADRWLLRAVDVIAAETGRQRVFLIGHSLGGTLAAVFSALHPERVAGLVLLEAPVRFGAVGALGRFVAATPQARHVVKTGTIPGSFLDLSAWMAAPVAFSGARWFDSVLSLAAGPEALRLHIAVERWTLDELPMPRRLFEQVVDDLYRGDAFMRGTLEVGGRRARAADVRSPILSVVNSRSDIVPPAAVLPFLNAVATAEKKTLDYLGDVGVALQHVGVLVGPSAHRWLWPEILVWMRGPRGGL
jgi:polyhydroxyalkanoate synthase subunit PhaC